MSQDSQNRKGKCVEVNVILDISYKMRLLFFGDRGYKEEQKENSEGLMWGSVFAVISE